LIAAFKSRSISNPQESQLYMRSFKVRLFLTSPQFKQGLGMNLNLSWLLCVPIT